MPTPHTHTAARHPQSGNILVIILIAIALIGALSVAIQGTSNQSATIDKESLVLRISEVRRYASELERGIAFIMQNGHSEADIRFSHLDIDTDYGDLSADADKSDQLFAREGGGATYRPPSSDIAGATLGHWEFYGTTTMPNVGSDRADLVAVLGQVNQEFCDAINKSVGYAAQPEDPSTCLASGASNRFGASTQFLSSPNTVTDSTFSVKPSMEGCIECTGDGSLHYFRVLLAR